MKRLWRDYILPFVELALWLGFLLLIWYGALSPVLHETIGAIIYR